MIDDAGEGVGAVPFAEFDPAVRPVGEKILIGIEGQVLFVEVCLKVEHMAKADEPAVIRSSCKRRILGKGSGEQVSGEETFL